MDWDVIKAEKEAHISKYYQNDNFTGGVQGVLFSGRYRGEGDAYRIYIHFSLQQLGQLTQPKQLRAYLRLFVYRNELNVGAAAHALYQVLAPWDGKSICWRKQPACSPKPASRFLVPAGWQGFMLVDVTSIFWGWTLGRAQNYGLMIKGEEGRDSLIAFHGGAYPFPNTVPAILIGSR